MSNAFKTVVTSTVRDEVSRLGYSLPYGADSVIEAVADRLADHVEEKAKGLVEQVEGRYSSTDAQFALGALTEAGFITEPEPEPEPEPAVEQSTESSDEPAPAWAQGLITRLDALEALGRRAQERGLI